MIIAAAAIPSYGYSIPALVTACSMRLAREPRLTAPVLLVMATAPPEDTRTAPEAPEAEAAEARVAREEADD